MSENKKNKDWEKLKINFLEYFWSTSALSAKNEKNLPYYLNKIEIFKEFSEIELYELVQYTHIRNFSEGEEILNENDYGIGFYIILSGSINVTKNSNKNEDEPLTLYPNMYFGEKNLLLEKSKCNANFIASDNCKLAAILTPDLDNMIDKKPRVAVKFIKSLSKISLMRLEEIEKRISSLGKIKHEL